MAASPPRAAAQACHGCLCPHAEHAVPAASKELSLPGVPQEVGAGTGARCPPARSAVVPQRSCEPAPSAGFTVLEVSSSVPVLPMHSVHHGQPEERSVVHAQLVPTQHPLHLARSREPGPCKPQSAAEVGKGLFAPLLVSFAQHYGRAGISDPACILGGMQEPKQTAPCDLLQSKFGGVWGKNSQGAVSHKGGLWQSWSPCLSPAGSATLTPHGNGSVFGFAWRNSPQARRGAASAWRASAPNSL